MFKFIEKQIRTHTWWISLSVLILIPGIYSGTDSASILGGIGLMAVLTVIVAALERWVEKISNYHLYGVNGVLLFMLSIIYDVLIIIFPDTMYSQVGIHALVIAFMLLFVIDFLGKKQTYLGRVSGLLMILGVTVALCYMVQNCGKFLPDSYSYYEISQTFFNDFGRVGTIRQYVRVSDYNMSFPYFYPFCIFWLDKVTGLGIYTGVLINFFVLILTGVIFLEISRNFTSRLWCGAIAAFLLWINPYYLEEVCTALSIPLTILLVTICLYICGRIYFEEKNSGRYVLVAGGFAGLTMVTRFDGMVLFGFCSLLMLFIQRDKRIKNLCLYMIGALFTLIPWIIYSLIHFGTLWISDNSGTMFLVNTMVPSYVFLPDEFIATLFNSPLLWFKTLLGKMLAVGKSLLCCSPVADLLLLLLIIVYILYIRKNRGELNKKKKIVIILTIVFWGSKTFMYSLVGYGDIRYHIESVVLVTFICMMTVVGEKTVQIGEKGICMLALVVSLLAGAGLYKNVDLFFTGVKEYPLSQIGKEPEWVAKLNREMENVIDDKEAGILFLEGGFEFGGWTDWKIYVTPIPANWERINYAMNKYMDVSYVILPQDTALPEEIFDNLATRYEKKEVDGYWIFSTKSIGWN